MSTVIDAPLDRALAAASPAAAPAHRVWGWTYRALLLTAVALAVFATVVPWAIQRSGTRLVTITSGSMTPLFPVGSTIAVHDVADPTTLQPGQIITFKALGNGTVITHRIVARVQRSTLPQVHYQTKGDANRTPDPDLAPASNVIAVADGVLPAWQESAVSLQTPKGRLVVYGGLFAVIALGELVDLIALWRRRHEEVPA
jgi:signal peptidase